jgi:hypothetical protein
METTGANISESEVRQVTRLTLERDNCMYSYNDLGDAPSRVEGSGEHSADYATNRC